ncbi:hypothetical protein LXL04_005112 [Taraxacum kok-saghyz]
METKIPSGEYDGKETEEGNKDVLVDFESKYTGRRWRSNFKTTKGQKEVASGISGSRFFLKKEGGEGGKAESRSFENSYIPENPRTPKTLTFSKNRLRGAKNRSNISPVAKKNFRKNDFFFPKTLHMCKLFFCAYVHSFLSIYNTYLNRFVKKNLKKNAKKKSCTYAQKIKKSCTYAKVKKKYRFFGNFFQRIVMIKNVLEGSEVGFLKGITKIGGVLGFSGIYEFSKDPNTIYIYSVGSFENSYIPENPRTPLISYISQTVIPFKKPTSEPSKTGFETKQKTVHICTKKKVCTYAKFLEKKNRDSSYENASYCENCWDLLRTHIFPRTRELPQFPISPKPLFLSKNRLRDSPKRKKKKICPYAKFLKKKSCFFGIFFFATGLKIERFLAPRSRFFEKVNGLGVLGAVQMRTIIGGGNGGTNLGHLFQFVADQFSDAGALLSAQHM